MSITTPERLPTKPKITPEAPEKEPLAPVTPEVEPEGPLEDPDFFPPKKEPAIEPAKD